MVLSIWFGMRRKEGCLLTEKPNFAYERKKLDCEWGKFFFWKHVNAETLSMAKFTNHSISSIV